MEPLRRREARRTMLAFTQYTFPKYRANYHHRILAEYLDEFLAGRIKRLLVLMPPQHGKSELVTRRLSAKWLGNDPEKRLLVCSHSSKLATSMNRDVQQIIDSPAYRDIFPNTKMRELRGAGCAGRAGQVPGPRPAGGTYVRRTLDYFELVGHGGWLRTAGVGQRIAGNPCDVGIVDDPFGSREDAESPTIRNKIWSWYTGDFYTRLGADAPILVTHTPWHRDDVQGRLLRNMLDKTADQWIVLAFPAIKVEPPLHANPHDTRRPGEPLWPEFKPLEELKKIEAQDRRMFAALYQLNPAEGGGTYWNPEYFTKDIWCSEKDWPADKFDLKVLGVDASRGSQEGRVGDYCAIVFVGRVKATNMLYVDANLEPRDSKDVVRAVRQFAERHRPSAISFETDQFQNLLVYQMQIDGFDLRKLWQVFQMPTGGVKKELRIQRLSTWIEQRMFKFRETPGCRLLVDQLMDFPRADFDDGPDALEQAIHTVCYKLDISYP